MIQRTLGAATAVILLLCAATAAQADVIQTTDGKWWPKRIQRDMEGAEEPSDAVLKKSGRNNLELSYDRVTIAGQNFSAAEVAKVYATIAYENYVYKNGHRHAVSRYWAEAADSFGEAAESLKGAAREIALFNRVTCLAATKDAPKAFEAAQQLLDSFPSSFFFGRVQETRARILIGRGDSEAAGKALDEVINAPRMNARDYFEAKLAKVYLLKFKVAGIDKAKYAAVRAEYDRVVHEIESRRATKIAHPQWLKGKVGVGRCHVHEGNYAKAQPYFDQVISDKKSIEHKTLLAQAYTGRGDVRYAAVKKELAGGNVGDDRLARITEALTNAVLDYVRVAKFYVEYAGDDLYAATVGAARVWAMQFHLTGDRDCQLAKRSCKYFFAAHEMLPPGEMRRLLRNEVIGFRAKRDEACKMADAASPR